MKDKKVKEDYTSAIKILLDKYYQVEPLQIKKHARKPLNTSEDRAAFERYYDRQLAYDARSKDS